MLNAYSQRMSVKTDEELIRIVTVHRLEYHPDAIAAAEAEIALRQIPAGRLEMMEKQQVAGETLRSINANQRLETSLKVLAFLLPGLFIFWFVLAIIFWKRGYSRKAGSLSWWVFYGCLPYLGIGLFSLVVGLF